MQLIIRSSNTGTKMVDGSLISLATYGRKRDDTEARVITQNTLKCGKLFPFVEDEIEET